MMLLKLGITLIADGKVTTPASSPQIELLDEDGALLVDEDATQLIDEP